MLGILFLLKLVFSCRVVYQLELKLLNLTFLEFKILEFKTLEEELNPVIAVFQIILL